MTEPVFWRLHGPDYESDSHALWVNGGLEHSLGLPGVECETCGQTWSGGRVLPYPCPAELRERQELNETWPISARRHRVLRDEVRACLKRDGHAIEDLQPGDRFQPGYLDVPTIPRSDFLWSSLTSVVVSQRFKALFEEHGVAGVTFCAAILRRIGGGDASRPMPLPATGEPEDLFEEIDLLENTDGIGPYWEMIVTAESKPPPGREPISICPSCGRRDRGEWRPEEARGPEDIPRMHPPLWTGEDVFFLGTTLHVVVTDRVREILQMAKATNVRMVRA